MIRLVIQSNDSFLFFETAILLSGASEALLSLFYSIAKALETIATGLLSVAPSSVTRPKLMVRPRRTTRASASTSEAETARMKCVVWSTVVIGR